MMLFKMELRLPVQLVLALVLLIASANAGRCHNSEDVSIRMNDLVASFGSIPDPFNWLSFYSLPRTEQAAREEGWAVAESSRAMPEDVPVSTLCRKGDYRVCLLFDAAGSVAGLQVSVSVKDFEASVGSERYPIDLETQWKRQMLLDTEVFSATALFVSPSVLSDGGRPGLTDCDDTVPETLFLENGNSYWAMPSQAQDAGAVAYTKQGCLKGMGRHFFYNMSPSMACEEHRPFFLLFDDVTGVLHGFGITLFGKSSSAGWFSRGWLEAPNRKVVAEMAPEGPQCLLDWTQQNGLVTLHVYFKPKPWKIQCA